MGEEALLLEAGELGPDRGGAPVDPAAVGDRARADGPPVLDVALDHHAEDRLLSLGEHRPPDSRRRPRRLLLLGSLPGPPRSRSRPLPPRRTSRPAWPKSRSLPAPPISLSRPAPPQIRSLPASPLTLSRPPRVAITSANFEPLITSRPVVPTIVAKRPPHLGGTTMIPSGSENRSGPEIALVETAVCSPLARSTVMIAPVSPSPTESSSATRIRPAGVIADENGVPNRSVLEIVLEERIEAWPAASTRIRPPVPPSI